MGLTEGEYQKNINYSQFLPTISYSKIGLTLNLCEVGHLESDEY
jgi:hypothetical protein